MKKVSLFIILAAVLFLFARGTEAVEGENRLMKIRISTDNGEIIAVLNNTSPAQELYQQLPIRLKMHPHQSREFYAEIKLAKNDEIQNNYAIGDIAYWTPGEALVLFYNQGYTGNLIVMGKMVSGLENLSETNHSFTALIEKTED